MQERARLEVCAAWNIQVLVNHCPFLRESADLIFTTAAARPYRTHHRCDGKLHALEREVPAHPCWQFGAHVGYDGTCGPVELEAKARLREVGSFCSNVYCKIS